ncbi:hypothetical protein [Actinomadura sp. 21ATH]|uniref:hypothetical protein n=1 Tax=Actinomadura sp. 21ATH TaxID=1735444 RepID=UPI0035C18AF7
MAWLRDSDDYTQRPEWDGVSYEARWHYRCMLEFCSRSRRWDGRLPLERARRVSDVPDPDRCIAELEAIGYAIVTRNPPVDNPGSDADVTRNVTSHVTSQNASHVTPETVTLPRIDEHIPPKGMRNNAPASKIRMQRKRAHDRGEHHLCLPQNCPHAGPPQPPPGSSEVARNTDSVTRNSGTGLNQSSRSTTEPPADDDESSQSGRVGGPGGGPERGVTRNGQTDAERDEIQNRKGATWLTQHWPGVDEQVAAHVIGRLRDEAAARQIPIQHMVRYLERMQKAGDLAAYVGAAFDHFDRLEAEQQPPSLQAIPGQVASSDDVARPLPLFLQAVPDETPEHPAETPELTEAEREALRAEREALLAPFRQRYRTQRGG